MKRSRHISLALFVGASALSISGCGKSQDEADNSTDDQIVFADQAACEKSYPASDCDRFQAGAQTDYWLHSPRYKDKESCEAEYGVAECRGATIDGAAVFLPALAGFAVAKLSSGLSPKAIYYGKPAADCERDPGGSDCKRPAYSGSHYFGYVAGGSSAARTSGSTVVSRGAFSGSTSSVSALGSVARGGFGATASAHGGGGGGE